MGESTRHCYVCDRWLPLEAFWQGKRICKTCQSDEYRRPETLFGVKVLANPPPKREGKCSIAACTMAAVVEGLCCLHDWLFRGGVQVVFENSTRRSEWNP